MKKYIIKNCPKLANTNRRIGAIFDTCGGIDYDTDEFEYCKDIPDCLLKRIVELCKAESEPQYLYERDRTGKAVAILSVKYNQGAKLAKKILELLEIEECE